MHRYLYAYGNPTTYVDPDGHFAVSTAIGIGIAVGAVWDYLFSDRRERVADQIGAETAGEFILSNTVALTQSVSNTVTFGYFDATMQPGGVGAVEHSIQMSGYRSYEGAYEVFTSEDFDSSEKAVLVPLYVLKGMGETASSGLLLYGAKTQFTAGMPARTAGRTAVGRVAARDTALERAAFEENIAIESRLAVKTARREAALAKAAYREELIALESREAIRAAGSAPKKTVHKNSLDYVGETHVYSIKKKNGTYKVGESAQGVRKRDGQSIRAEQQARDLLRETDEFHETTIRRTFQDKRSAVEYQDRLRDRFRSRYGQDTLPGNREHLRGKKK